MPTSKTSSYPDINQNGYIAGWGLTKNKDPTSSPNVLQNVKVNIYESELCFLENGDSQICLGKIFQDIDAQGQKL